MTMWAIDITSPQRRLSNVRGSGAKIKRGSRQYAHLRIDVASAQIFAQNRNFASRKQTAQTRQYVIRDA